MSLSQLLAITESHGFRALVAAVVSLVDLLVSLGYGLRNRSCVYRQIVREDGRGRCWLRIFARQFAGVRWEPVLWFDTLGQRAGPQAGEARYRLKLHDGSFYHCRASSLVEQAVPCHSGHRRT